jgi:hypothetical protein
MTKNDNYWPNFHFVECSAAVQYQDLNKTPPPAFTGLNIKNRNYMKRIYAWIATLFLLPSLDAQTARLQVIHNSPAPTVDIYANDLLFLENLAFREASPFRDVPAGVPITIGVAPAGSETPVFTQELTFESGRTYVVVANGVVGEALFPFGLVINDMGREESSNPDKTDVVLFHGSPGAPNVDVDERLAGKLFSDLGYGRFSEYVSLDPAVYYLDVKVTGLPNILATFQADLSGLGGQAVTVFASGFVTTQPAFGVFAALADGTVVQLPASPVARVQLIHNSPAPTVDIYANGDLLLEDFAFREATPFIYLPAGVSITVEVAPAGIETPIFSQELTFENGRTYVVTAGGVVGQAAFPFTLMVNDMGREQAADEDKVDVAILHGSPGAPNVDVAARNVGDLANNLAYGSYTPYLSLDPQTYFLDIRAAGIPNILATFRADLGELAGQALTVFASGFVTTQPAFGVFAALSDGTVVQLPASPVARAQLIHNSPSTTVDIYIDGELALENFAFQTATPFDFAPAGVPITIGVAPAGSEETVFETELTFENGRTYIVIANGVVGSEQNPFDLVVNDMAQEIAADEEIVDVLVFHGSPGAPAVDVVTGVNATVISNLAFGQFSSYLGLDPRLYLLDLIVSGFGDRVATFGADLSALSGQAVTVLASGVLGSEEAPFGLIAVLADGTVVPIPLANSARLQVIHNSPSPTVDIYVNSERLLDNFEFRTATPFFSVPAGVELDIAAAPGGSESVGEAIANFPGIVLDSAVAYVVVATGVVGSEETPFDLSIFPDARERAANGVDVDLLLYHGAPDAPAVDVVVDGGPVIFEDVAYGDFAGYITVDPGEYTLNVTPTGDNETVVRAYRADLSEVGGTAITAFASGFLAPGEGEPEFAVWAALADGTTFALMESTRVNRLANQLDYFQVAPNPTIDKTLVSFGLKESQPLSIHLFDINGRLLRTQFLGNQPSGEHTFTVDLSNLPAGIYNLSLMSNQGVATRRVAVTR